MNSEGLWNLYSCYCSCYSFCIFRFELWSFASSFSWIISFDTLRRSIFNNHSNSNYWIIAIWSWHPILFINRTLFVTSISWWKSSSTNYFLWGSKIASCRYYSCCIYIWEYVRFLGRILFNTISDIHKSCLERLARPIVIII